MLAQMDLDDKIVHYLLIGLGGAAALLLKEGAQKLAAMFWDTEYSQFRNWKHRKAVREHAAKQKRRQQKKSTRRRS